MTVMLPERTPQPALAPRMGTTEKLDYCRALAASGLLPAQYRQQPANLLYAVEFADSLGLHPMVAITGVHVIEGKPSASSALISALVRRAGHKLRVRGDALRAVAQIVRADDPEFTFEVAFTIDDADRAGLMSKKIWKNYPASMLKARAISAVARDACEEALFGIHYTPEELGAEVDGDGNVIEPTFARQAPAQDAWEQATPAPAQQTPPEPTPPAEPEQRRDFIAEAIATSDLDALAGITLAAADAGAPGWYRSQLDDIAEAHLAADGVAVRKLYDALTVKGAPADHLARIEVIGRAKAATPGTAGSGTTAASATAPATASPASDPLPGSPDDPKARGMAVVDMYAAGRDNSLTPSEVQQAFMDRYKHGVDAATAAELAEFTADLTAAAGAR